MADYCLCSSNNVLWNGTLDTPFFETLALAQTLNLLRGIKICFTKMIRSHISYLTLCEGV